jgi:hypothetical protein
MWPDPELNAVAGLFLVRAARARTEAQRRSTLDVIDGLTELPLQHRSKHLPATDITGITWTEAYGVLPVSLPPAELVAWVHESGRRTGAISGVTASAWRTLFLISARHWLNWRGRPHADRELSRRIAYLCDRLPLLREHAHSRERVSSVARQIFLLAAIAQRTESDRLVDGAAELCRLLMEYVEPDGSLTPDAADRAPTAHALQLALAAQAVGDADGAARVVDTVLATRGRETGLLHTVDAPIAPIDFNPWVALAAVSVAHPDTLRPETPRAL